MRITYQLSKQDLIEALQEHGGAWNKIPVVLGMLLLVIGVTYLALNPRQFPTPIGVIAGGLVLTFSGRWRAGSTIRDKRLQNQTEAVLSEEGVEISTSTASSKLSWDAFTRYGETKDLFMIYQSATIINIFPKSAFPPNDVETISAHAGREIRERNVGQKKRRSVRECGFF